MQLPDTIKGIETPKELVAAKELRIRVFVEEQGVPAEEEIDDLDSTAFHAIAIVNGSVIGTGRLLVDSPQEARIGRMAVSLEHRRGGIGGLVLQFLEGEAKSQGIGRITLNAQRYVTSFYANHGYKEVGEPFTEAGIPHIQMIKNLS
ncbi:MAG: GNAT family N-acetyltransferase [Chloroflexota bacterium]|nr:GNAT family N-acetyltransferase [Chloroflexota bacterium]